MCMSLQGSAHECRCHRGQQRALEFLELELQVFASCLLRVLQTEIGPLQEQCTFLTTEP